ncbi:hypothetical protein GCM10011379_57710 [Filimonas zeae]|uniref:Uncharacterized protein n=1 Tax=Filimonas zeae TaxID=1737353 RepID=A0A917J3X2_9BACT|nr:hypothetical protein GCM10011379_57710 [Filimonas zeae]
MTLKRFILGYTTDNQPPKPPGIQFDLLGNLFTFAAQLIILIKIQGNEQLRIDGDFYPCAF